MILQCNIEMIIWVASMEWSDWMIEMIEMTRNELSGKNDAIFTNWLSPLKEHSVNVLWNSDCLGLCVLPPHFIFGTARMNRIACQRLVPRIWPLIFGYGSIINGSRNMWHICLLYDENIEEACCLRADSQTHKHTIVIIFNLIQTTLRFVDWCYASFLSCVAFNWCHLSFHK